MVELRDGERVYEIVLELLMGLMGLCAACIKKKKLQRMSGQEKDKM